MRVRREQGEEEREQEGEKRKEEEIGRKGRSKGKAHLQ